MNQVKLPVRPDPYPDESAASLLIRLAEMNGHKNVYQLISGTGIRLNLCTLRACLADLPRYRQITDALCLGEDAAARPLARVGTSRFAPRQFESAVLPDIVFRRDDARVFCPMCLKDAPYWRQRWLIRPISACIKHRRLLLDRCGECGQALGIARGELTRCNHCQASLLNMRTQPVKTLPLMKLQAAMQPNQAADLREILGFWIALTRFDGEDSCVKTDHERLKTAISFYSEDGVATKKIARRVRAQRGRCHPRIQLLPFLSGTTASALFAESIIKKVPAVRTPGGGDLTPPLSKIDVCRILRIGPSELGTLIQNGRLKWESEKGREQKIRAFIIEDFLRLQDDFKKSQ